MGNLDRELLESFFSPFSQKNKDGEGRLGILGDALSELNAVFSSPTVKYYQLTEVKRGNGNCTKQSSNQQASGHCKVPKVTEQDSTVFLQSSFTWSVYDVTVKQSSRQE